MNQHHIQKAYLKNFEHKGKIFVFNKSIQKFHLKPAKECTAETNFQSEYLEKFQNLEIEDQGIRKLRKIVSDSSLNEEEINQIMYWTALHAIRNKNFRMNSGLSYELAFQNLFNTEKLFSNYFRTIFRYSCINKKEFFITSDNPIIDYKVGEHIFRILTLTPKTALLFSPIDKRPTHIDLSFPDIVNSMLFSSCYKEIYSDRNTLDIDSCKKHKELYNLDYNWEEIRFKIKK